MVGKRGATPEALLQAALSHDISVHSATFGVESAIRMYAVDAAIEALLHPPVILSLRTMTTVARVRLG